jgi:hypothetical protein
VTPTKEQGWYVTHNQPLTLMKSSLTTDTTIMTRREIADWLKVKPREVERLGVPCIPLGRKTVRYLKADVLQWLQGQRRMP